MCIRDSCTCCRALPQLRCRRYGVWRYGVWPCVETMACGCRLVAWPCVEAATAAAVASNAQPCDGQGTSLHQHVCQCLDPKHQHQQQQTPQQKHQQWRRQQSISNNSRSRNNSNSSNGCHSNSNSHCNSNRHSKASTAASTAIGLGATTAKVKVVSAALYDRCGPTAVGERAIRVHSSQQSQGVQ